MPDPDDIKAVVPTGPLDTPFSITKPKLTGGGLLAKPTPVDPLFGTGLPFFTSKPPGPTGGTAAGGGPMDVAPPGGIDWAAFQAKYFPGTAPTVTGGAEAPIPPGPDYPEGNDAWKQLMASSATGVTDDTYTRTPQMAGYAKAVGDQPVVPTEAKPPPWALDLDKLDPMTRSIIEEVIPWLTTGGTMTDAGGLLDTFSTFLTEQFKAEPLLTDPSGKTYKTISEFFAPLKDIDVTTYEGEQEYKNESQMRFEQATQWQALRESWRTNLTSGMSTMLAQHAAARRDALDFVNSVLDRQFAAGSKVVAREEKLLDLQKANEREDELEKARIKREDELEVERRKREDAQIAAGVVRADEVEAARIKREDELETEHIKREDKLEAERRAREDELVAAGIVRADALEVERREREDALELKRQKREDELIAAGIKREDEIILAREEREDKLEAARVLRENELIAAGITRENEARIAREEREDELTKQKIASDKIAAGEQLERDKQLSDYQNANVLKVVAKEDELVRERIKMEQTFQAAENALNRAIQQGELNEAVRANKAKETADSSRLALDREIQQWSVLSSLLESGGAKLMTMAMANPAEAINYLQPLIASLPPETQQLVAPQLNAPMAAASKFRGQQAEYGELSIPSASEFAAMSPDEAARYEAAFGTQGQSFTSQVARRTPGSVSGVTRAR